MWLLDVQSAPPALALSTKIAAQQAAAASLECAAQLAAAAWRSGQQELIATSLGALLNQSFDSGRSGSPQQQQVIHAFHSYQQSQRILGLDYQCWQASIANCES